jgi:hypothetical protein
MKRALRLAVVLLGVLAVLPGVASAASISVSTGQTAAVLAQSLLAGASGISISGASYTGATIANGLFTDVGGVLGVNSGIVLSSGNAAGIVGPNSSSNYGPNNNLAGDAALTALAGKPTYDASILEIVFTPTSNFVTFNYVFGSEEYNEYVGTQYNDVFGFFVNGVNYATVNNLPVTINNINCGSNSGYYRNNDGTGSTGCPSLGLDTQLDGLTVVLSFVAPVLAGQNNTLRLAIADSSDGIYDSDVMIQGGSFQVCGAPGMPACPSTVPEPTSMLLIGTGLAGLAGRAVRKLRK